MVTRREAALARACRALLQAYKNGERDGGSVDWDDIDQAHDLAEQALDEKTSYGRRRVVVCVEGGKTYLSWKDRGVKLTLKNLDTGETEAFK